MKDYSPAALDKAAEKLLAALEKEAAEVKTEPDGKAFRDRWVARKNGVLTQINDLWLKAAPKDAKREVGQRVNELMGRVETRVTEVELQCRDLAILKKAREAGLDARIDEARRALELSDRLDITLPGIPRPLGAEHPVIKTMNEIVSVFRNLGYSVQEGPVIETDYYNFEALNFPPNHPARDTQDTLFIANQEATPLRERLLLRTHTSPVQIRTMEKMKPPIRIVIPGKVHRNDPPDASHSPMFHQIEGLAVDTNITFGDLKGTLDHAMKALFGSNVKTSFRPSFFPFTEPSAEMMVTCFICGGGGKRGAEPCRPCKQTGWIEILGCGMVDPNVFEFVKDKGYDPKKISGFAFGMGADRVALLKYGVDDIQLFFQGDVRFLRQFA
ncbi:MAG: phenylalanine--tRNA ligase subunit alpha [Acidobacteriia bacterium]|nr:phenylalanine--tRNA ligase subunit alpha [Terriglobia bacterium]